MLEITGDDIALLSDADLRTLVGRLCEAELRKSGVSTATVTYGGDQNATDGGLDVRISVPTGTGIHGFIPRPHTGYQVKRSDMPRAKIRAEMRPKGKLPLRANIDETVLPVIITEQGENRNQCE